ncbi:gfo/Idh/MocA family oxidoreductase [Altericroceibacterium spongiae]|uniref:Gfo/Idh/MocA family oxidoreductase n=1 Tax=Altericroceibacterium spongiae TaxID=2320269 RepID=A0A420EME3_9SPHN|nr:Gfo/Idh/MocA family oxidoreductase [Altericroceibacterium spongiae]RKF21774.1 gfo/Idh/MocA family oxidoreductase [Altericroceibacterium spongiae]
MKSVNLGIVGLGRGFMLTLPALRSHPLVRLVGAFDLRPEALAQFAEEFGGRGHKTLESLLTDPKVEAVYIATPHGAHAEQAIAALRAGRHVLVEKPMATTVSDCARMAQAAEKAGQLLMVGPSHGFDEPVRVAADLVASGRYGPVRQVTTFNFTDFMYRPRRPEELDDQKGGGVVYSQAAHQIDVVRRIIGQPVASVRAVTGNWDKARPSAGAYTALMTFKGGAAASLTYSGYAHYDSDELVGWISELGQKKDSSRYGEARKALTALSGEKEIRAKLSRTYGVPGQVPASQPPHHEHFGFLLVSCEHADLKVLPTGIEVFSDKIRETVEVAPPALPRASVIEEFAEALSDPHRAVHDGRWGLDTMACCAALARSSEVGAEIDPHLIIQEETEKLT